MLGIGKFPTQVLYNTLLHNPVSQNSLFSSKPRLSFPTRLDFHTVLGRIRGGLCCNAFETKKNGGFSLKETDGSDEFEEDFDDEFLEMDEDGEFGVEDDDVFVPLSNMKEWLANRPRGFGEGKVYDTSIEDKLMEEIEQSRKAQLVNLNNLKNSRKEISSKKETFQKDKGLTHCLDGIRVRLVNLPKKKNIHKDLRLAFKEVPGLVDIVPVVSGNEKTRDPVCKGIAFIDFKNGYEAQRFIQNFSGKSISFGKVQKQIKCEMMDSKLSKSDPPPQQTRFNLDEALDADVESSEESAASEYVDADEMFVSGQWEEEDDGVINGTSAISDSDLAEELEVGEESAINSSSSKPTRKLKTNDKKVAAKPRKEKKIPKLSIPGSANKLKIREKAVLTDVFSKYGANAASAVKEKSR